jgi:hypothetical protein
MRVLVSLLVVAAVVGCIYFFTLNKMPTTDPGTAPTQAISLTGVRSDLLQIAQAERSNIALNAKCVALEELISTNSLTMTRPEREGYTYSLVCSGVEFTVTAHHAPAPPDSPVRYPILSIDQNMTVQVRDSN